MHKRHLQALGITPWVRRSNPQQAVGAASRSTEVAPPGPVQLNQPEMVLGTILVEWSKGELQLVAEHPGGHLLAGIVAALGKQLDQFQVVQLPPGAAQQEADLPLDGSLVLCFAQHWQSKAGQRDGRDWLVLPSLQQMLSEQQFKRQAWRQLKPWAERLK